MKEREAARRVKEAYQRGLLDPLFEVLDDHAARLGAPKEPEGPEWPYKRAFLDGRLNEVEAIRTRILALAHYSTDGSENTEDEDE